MYFFERFLYQLRNALLATLGGKHEQSGVLFVLDLYRCPHKASLIGMHYTCRVLGAVTFRYLVQTQ